MTEQTSKEGFILLMSKKFTELLCTETPEEEKEVMKQISNLYDQHIELVILTHDLDKK